MTSSSSRLQELLDREDLTQLVTGIGRCLDTKDFDGLTRIYTHSAELVMPGTVSTGVTGIVDTARRSHDMFRQTQHLIAGTTVELDGDRAKVVANVMAALVTADGPGLHLVGSRYEFDAVRAADGWRFVSHVITPVWDLPRP